LTLAQLDELIRSTVSARRAAVENVLAGRPAPPAAVARLSDVLARLEALPEEEGGRRVLMEEGRPIHLDLEYEIDELRRDLVYLTAGEAALRDEVEARHEGQRDEVAAVVRALAGTRFATFLTDRDGTIVNYCGRYASSVQPAWTAAFITRFARAAARRAVVLTSGPLRDTGIVDLSVTPPRDFLLAGSKGREYQGDDAERRSHPIDGGQQERLDELNRRLDRLVQEPDNEIFSLVGSGLQHKFGQTTVARQDVASSIPPEQSERFLGSVRALVDSLDPGGRDFRVEDTGLDIEIILTVDDSGGPRDFDKGDGVRFLDDDVPLNLAEGPALVCGDTEADVPMLEAALERSPLVRSVFVARRDELRARVRTALPDALFVSEPDALVSSLAALAETFGGE